MCPVSTVCVNSRRTRASHRLNSRHFGFAGETLHGTVCVFIFVVVLFFLTSQSEGVKPALCGLRGVFFFFLECMKEIQCDFYLSNTKNEEGCFWVS